MILKNVYRFLGFAVPKIYGSLSELLGAETHVVILAVLAFVVVALSIKQVSKWAVTATMFFIQGVLGALCVGLGAQFVKMKVPEETLREVAVQIDSQFMRYGLNITDVLVSSSSE
jgi:tetrahydromethanopterin S-methyltransferase subunit C